MKSEATKTNCNKIEIINQKSYLKSMYFVGILSLAVFLGAGASSSPDDVETKIQTGLIATSGTILFGTCLKFFIDRSDSSTDG